MPSAIFLLNNPLRNVFEVQFFVLCFFASEGGLLLLMMLYW